MEPVKYQLSKREYVITTALKFWCRKRILLINSVLLIMFFVCLIPDPPLYSTAIFVIACIILFPIIHLSLLIKITKANPNFVTSEKTLIIDKDGIKVSTATTSSSMNWSVFKKWSEDNKYIFLYYNNLQSSFIPKRTFTNEQLAEIKTLLADKIQPSSKEILKNEKRYGLLPFFISFASLVISIFPFLMYPLTRSERISIERFQQIWHGPLHFPLWVWIPGFILALVSLNMVSGSRDILRKIVVWIFSLLAIIMAMLWAISATVVLIQTIHRSS